MEPLETARKKVKFGQEPQDQSTKKNSMLCPNGVMEQRRGIHKLTQQLRQGDGAWLRIKNLDPSCQFNFHEGFTTRLRLLQCHAQTKTFYESLFCTWLLMVEELLVPKPKAKENFRAHLRLIQHVSANQHISYLYATRTPFDQDLRNLRKSPPRTAQSPVDQSRMALRLSNPKRRRCQDVRTASLLPS